MENQRSRRAAASLTVGLIGGIMLAVIAGFYVGWDHSTFWQRWTAVKTTPTTAADATTWNSTDQAVVRTAATSTKQAAPTAQTATPATPTAQSTQATPSIPATPPTQSVTPATVPTATAGPTASPPPPVDPYDRLFAERDAMEAAIAALAVRITNDLPPRSAAQVATLQRLYGPGTFLDELLTWADEESNGDLIKTDDRHVVKQLQQRWKQWQADMVRLSRP